MTGIYLITNLVNGKHYVGQSIDIRKRMWSHKKPGSKSIVSMAIHKYGINNFKIDVLEECSVEELDAREAHWISEIKPEYNILLGASGAGRCVPKEIKDVLSKKSKLWWESLDDKAKQSIINNHLTGPRKGHAVSEETRAKLRAVNVGKKQSEETIEKRRESVRKRREQGIKKDGSGHFKKVVCLETNVVYESVKAAAVAIGVQPSQLCHVLKGRQHKTRELHFAYYGVETIRDECNEVGLG